MVSRTINICSDSCEQRDKVTELITKANSYSSKLTLSCGSKTVNAKSLMGVMAIGLYSGEEYTLTADGEDEGLALNALAMFLETK